jgi:hypothetical protein
MKKKNYIFSAAVLLMASAMVASCTSDDMTSETTNGKNVVTAKAILDGTTRVAYNENTSGGGSGITAEWQSTDYLNVLEFVEGSTVTASCKFSISKINTDNTATFTSTDAVAPNTETLWMAILGKGATVNSTNKTITCGYDDQDGTLANLEKYDYRLTLAGGATPTFDFTAATATQLVRLSYFIRLKLPAGIKQIEFCTGSWLIDGDAPSLKASTDNVSTLTLENTSAAGEIVYVAVPATDYSKVGLIITIFNDLKANATQSQGKVISRNLENLGGQIGDYDMSGLTLMARPTSSVDMGTAGKWAPFNVGASTAAENGNYYQWGKTEQSYINDALNYDWSNYLCVYDECGTSKDPVFAAGLIQVAQITQSNSGSWSGSICNTKFDVARVKWGKGWRLPTYDEVITLTKLNNRSSFNNGYTLTASNSTNTIFLPAAGKYDGNYNTNDDPYVPATEGYYSNGNPFSAGSTAPLFFNNSTFAGSFDVYGDITRYKGLSVRPVSE